MSVPIEVARNARGSSSSKSSSGSSSMSSEGTVRRNAEGQQVDGTDELRAEEELIHAMLRRSASVQAGLPQEQIYFREAVPCNLSTTTMLTACLPSSCESLRSSRVRI